MRFNDTIHDFVMPNALADMPAARGAVAQAVGVLSWGCYGRLVTATCRRGDSERPVLELERTLSLPVREQNETPAASRSFLQCDRSRAR